MVNILRLTQRVTLMTSLTTWGATTYGWSTRTLDLVKRKTDGGLLMLRLV